MEAPLFERLVHRPALICCAAGQYLTLGVSGPAARDALDNSTTQRVAAALASAFDKQGEFGCGDK